MPQAGIGDSGTQSSERSREQGCELLVSLLVPQPVGCSPKEWFSPSMSLSWTATLGLRWLLGMVPEEARKIRREVGTAGLSKHT